MPRYAKRYSRKRPVYRKRTYRKRATTTKRRTTRKRTYQTRRRIADVSSTKKANQIMGGVPGADNTKPTIPTPTITFPATTDGITVIGWSPSVMPGSGGFGKQVRNRSQVYFKGFAERLEISGNTDFPLLHRRIVFAMPYDINQFMLADPTSTTNVYRNMTKVANLGDLAFLFKGTFNRDWFDQLRAPLDNQNITVIQDRIQTINPTGSSGYERYKKLWYPVGKNITFDDQENGDQTVWLATPNPRSLRYYVLDFFRGIGVSGTTGQVVKYGSNATVYWHEK